jgi:hypothetical protein
MRIIRRALILSSLALALSGGAAFADHYRGGYAHGGYSRPVVAHSYSPRVNVNVRTGYGHRGPIYMGRPVIRERYYNYRYRPSLIVENYAAMDGYVWVRGSWAWNGYEWIWQPGHYQPIY